MEYQKFIDEACKLDFIDNTELADAAVKGVLGRLASRLSEPDAQKFTEDLPEPLSYEKLRGMQVRPTPISAEQCIEDVREQFRLSHEKAELLVRTILHFTKDAVSKETLEEIENKLPSDWKSSLWH